MLDITLEYAVSQFDETLLNTIINEELSIDNKIAILTNLDESSKKIILLKLGYKMEFIKTL